MTLQFCSCDNSAILTPVINCTLLIWPPLYAQAAVGGIIFINIILVTVNVTGKIKQTKPFWEKKMYFDADFTLNQCLYQNKNPTFLPCQVGNTFLSNIFLRLVVVTDFFFGMAIFPILILEEQMSVESLVENQKSRLIFI